MPSSLYSQNDFLTQLSERIRSLEDASNAIAVPACLAKIMQYGFRREEDFDKYNGLAIAEQLATAAKLTGDEKAQKYDDIASTLWVKLPVSKKQFKAYF